MVVTVGLGGVGFGRVWLGCYGMVVCSGVGSSSVR